jgi:hypothetical protein
MSQDYSTTMSVKATPAQAYAAINNVRSWWGAGIEGRTDVLGEEWAYRYKDMHYSLQKTVELIPARKIVWRVIDADVPVFEDRSEWKGTSMVFDISEADGLTQVRFTHIGLRPDVECFSVCSNSWSGLIGDSLRKLIESGAGEPDSIEKTAA